MPLFPPWRGQQCSHQRLPLHRAACEHAEELLLTAVIHRRCLRVYLETGSDASCASRNSSNDSLGIEICCPPLAAEIAVPAPAPRVPPSNAPLPPPATPPTRAPSPAPRRPLLVVLPD